MESQRGETLRTYCPTNNGIQWWRSVMIWAGISLNRRTALVVPGNFNGRRTLTKFSDIMLYHISVRWARLPSFRTKMQGPIVLGLWTTSCNRMVFSDLSGPQCLQNCHALSTRGIFLAGQLINTFINTHDMQTCRDFFKNGL